MKTRRMFLAIWPNDKQVKRLHKLQSGYLHWGNEVPPENFHITLLFLGDISYPVAECISQGIQDVMVQPFHLSLDRLGIFEKKQIFWVGPSDVPYELESLYKSVRNCAQQCGITKLSKRYTPHLSLLRKCNVPISNPDFPPIELEIDEFHLIESRLDRDRARYYVVESFPLVSLV